MGLRRTTQNQRPSESEELLDVKLPSETEAPERGRAAAKYLVWALLLAAIGTAFWKGGQLALDRFIYKNPAFAIRQIDIATDGVLTTEAIRNWAKVRIGDNLLALDLMQVKRDLESQPCIDSVIIERALPRALRLRVIEREPVAQTLVMVPRPDGTFDQSIFLFDEDGHVMRPLDPVLQTQPPDPVDRLPMLLGARANELRPGARADSEQIRAALALLVEFERSPMYGLVDLQRINVSLPEILQATTSQGAEITFSLSNFGQQFRRWRAIYDMYEKTGRAVASLDLSVANNLPVRWVAAGALQPVAPKAAKPLRTRKKHV